MTDNLHIPTLRSRVIWNAIMAHRNADELKALRLLTIPNTARSLVHLFTPIGQLTFKATSRGKPVFLKKAEVAGELSRYFSTASQQRDADYTDLAHWLEHLERDLSRLERGASWMPLSGTAPGVTVSFHEVENFRPGNWPEILRLPWLAVSELAALDPRFEFEWCLARLGSKSPEDATAIAGRAAA
jgi:hypothetical protein